MTDCEDLYNARIRAALEGDYTTWTKQWQKDCDSDYDESGFIPEYIQYNETANKLILLYAGGTQRAIVNLTTGVINGTVVDTKSGGAADLGGCMSFSRYYIEVIDTGSTYNLLIYKDCALIQTIDLCTILSKSYLGGKWASVAISQDGKYITVSGYTDSPFFNTVALFKGA
jgi:hypothetical protein